MKKYYCDVSEEQVKDGIYMNSCDFMQKNVAGNEDLIAMNYYGKEISYGLLNHNIELYANKLKKYGLSQGDTITIILPNIPELVYFIYAAWKIGVRVNLIEPRFNSNGIKMLVEQCDSKLIITTPQTYNEKIRQISNEFFVENFLLINPLTSLNNCNDESIDLGNNRIILLNEFYNDIILSNIKSVYSDNMDATVVFTSGTSGFPKGAIFTHEAHNAKINQISYGVPNIAKGDKFLAAIPFFSAYGINAGMHNSLSKLMNMYMIPKLNVEDFGELIVKDKIQTAIGVPKHWELLMNNWNEYSKKYGVYDLSFLKNPVSGGDTLPPTLIKQLNEFFTSLNANSKIINGWGSTEGGGPNATTVNDSQFSDDLTSGVMFPSIKYILVDDENNIVENGIGELAISDIGGMKGYLNNNTATQEITVIKDGIKYFKTGDLFEINEKGMLYFDGRKKRAIMRPDGHTVHTLPIDNALMECDLVQDVCTVGLKRKEDFTGSVPIAFIVLKNDVEINDDLIKYLDDFCLERLPERNRAHAFTFVKELPYTLMGKVNYKLIEKNNLESLKLYVVDKTFLDDNTLSLNKK